MQGLYNNKPHSVHISWDIFMECKWKQHAHEIHKVATNQAFISGKRLFERFQKNNSINTSYLTTQKTLSFYRQEAAYH